MALTKNAIEISFSGWQVNEPRGLLPNNLKKIRKNRIRKTEHEFRNCNKNYSELQQEVAVWTLACSKSVHHNESISCSWIGIYSLWQLENEKNCKDKQFCPFGFRVDEMFRSSENLLVPTECLLLISSFHLTWGGFTTCHIFGVQWSAFLDRLPSPLYFTVGSIECFLIENVTFHAYQQNFIRSYYQRWLWCCRLQSLLHYLFHKCKSLLAPFLCSLGPWSCFFHLKKFFLSTSGLVQALGHHR